jgi:hypothetical protein
MGAASQPVEGAGIECKHEKCAAAERHENEIGHIRSPVGTEVRLFLGQVRLRLGRTEQSIKKR